MSKFVTIFGGSSFVGRYIVWHLCQKGYNVCVLTRNVQRASFLKTFGFPGQISLIQGDITDYSLLISIIKSSNIIVNAINTSLSEIDKNNVKSSIGDLISDYATKYNVDRLIHISSMNSAHEALQNISEKYSEISTILKIGFAFAVDSKYIHSICQIADFPAIILPKSVQYGLFYCVAASDVAEIVTECIKNDATKGKAYNIYSGKSYTMLAFIKTCLKALDKNPKIILIPNFIANLIAKVAAILPSSFLKNICLILNNTNKIPYFTDSNEKTYFKIFHKKPKILEEEISNIIYGNKKDGLYNSDIKINNYY